MNFATLCSGIGAPEVAASRVGGFKPVFASEIEPFPCAVLAHHYPDTPNYGDMTKWREWPKHDIDLLIAGTPCQSFSVAGLRRSLDDDRGNLTLEMARYAESVRPRFILWENVPGVLNTKDNAFGCLLGALAGSDAPLVPTGGRWTNEGFVAGQRRQIAWRILNAQYFGVAQRRRRIWLVAGDVERGAGNWACAAALFPLRESLRWHPASCDTAGEGVAGTLGGGSGSRGGEGVTVGAICAGTQGQTGQDAAQGRIVTVGTLCADVATVDARNKVDRGDSQHLDRLIAHTLRADGHDASEDGTGRGTPLVAVYQDSEYGVKAYDSAGSLRAGRIPEHQMVMHPATYFEPRCTRTTGWQPQEELASCLRADTNTGDGMPCVAHTTTTGDHYATTQETNASSLLRTLRHEVGEEAFAVWGIGVLDSLQPKEILQQALHGSSLRPAAFSRSWVVYCALSRAEGSPGWLLQSLRETGCEGCPPQGWEPPEQLARELGAYLSELSQPGAQAARFMRDLWVAADGLGLLRQALSAIQEVGRPVGRENQPTHPAHTVRRLVVEECEVLQGLPRGYTAIQHRGKPAADGPRYKALGNSMAVPCVEFILAHLKAANA